MSGRASVLITAHNAAGTIARPLEALAAQRLAAGTELEVVVVDDRSTDGTFERAVAAAPGARVLRATATDTAHGTARQLALELAAGAATGDLLSTLDADAVPPADWVEGIRHALAGADVVAWPLAFRPVTRRWSAWTIAALQTADVAFYLRTCSLLAALGAAAGVCFGAAGFRRAVLDRVGGFAPSGPTLAEDLAFARAAHAAGARIVFARGESVVVDAAPTVDALLARALRVGAVGGVSLLAVALGLGVATLPALAFLAAVGVVPWWLAGARWLAGCAYTLAALARGGRAASRAWPAAFVYESAAALGALAVMYRSRSARYVEWGGIRYTRAAIRRTSERLT